MKNRACGNEGVVNLPMRNVKATVSFIPKILFLSLLLDYHSQTSAKMNLFSRSLSAAILFLSSLKPASTLGLPLFSLSNQDAVNVVVIQQVIDLFAVVVDQHRWDLLSQVFQPDVVADFSIPDSPPVHGLDAMIQLLRRFEAYPSFHSQSSHYVDMSNPNRPHAVTYIMGVFFLPERIYTNYGRCVTEACDPWPRIRC